MKWGLRWVSDDDDFFPDSFYIGLFISIVSGELPAAVPKVAGGPKNIRRANIDAHFVLSLEAKLNINKCFFSISYTKLAGRGYR